MWKTLWVIIVLEAFILINMNQVYRQFIILFSHLRDHISYVYSAFIRSDIDVVERTVLDETPRVSNSWVTQWSLHQKLIERAKSDDATWFSESSLRFYAGHSVYLGERDKNHAKWSGTGRGGATSRVDVCKTIDRKVDACHPGYL